MPGLATSARAESTSKGAPSHTTPTATSPASASAVDTAVTSAQHQHALMEAVGRAWSECIAALKTAKQWSKVQDLLALAQQQVSTTKAVAA